MNCPTTLTLILTRLARTVKIVHIRTRYYKTYFRLFSSWISVWGNCWTVECCWCPNICKNFKAPFEIFRFKGCLRDVIRDEIEGAGQLSGYRSVCLRKKVFSNKQNLNKGSASCSCALNTTL